jgi:hypothetical protein
MAPLLVWLLTTLLAIAWMGDRPQLALLAALVGGVAMGVSSFLGYRAGQPEAAHMGSENLTPNEE